jgi:hypothetical protein
MSVDLDWNHTRLAGGKIMKYKVVLFGGFSNTKFERQLVQDHINLTRRPFSSFGQLFFFVFYFFG